MESKGDSPLHFEFDEHKSRLNKLKHGIDFVEAQTLWLDEALLEGRGGGAEEPRFLMIGRMRARHWSAVVTYRGSSVRLISVRRARAKEIEAYEGQ
jgi:uncharacterized DUF497 family protein